WVAASLSLLASAVTAPQSQSASRLLSVWGIYRMRLYQALAVYRFFAFALGIGVFFVLGADQGLLLEPRVLAVFVGLFNAARIVVPPFHLIRTVAAETALLAGEMALILALVLATGGLDSPFLISSLSPVLSAALFSSLWVAAGVGLSASAVTAGAHGAAMAGVGPWPGLSSGNYPVFAILYATVTILAIVLPFLTNLNLERRQRALAMAEERRKMQRDLHDDVAQTLAFLSLKAQRAEQHVNQGRGSLTAQDIRDIAQGLRRAYLTVRDLLDVPDARLPHSFQDALQQVAGSWSRATGLPVEFRGEAGSEPPISPEVQRHLLRITGEALANAARHGRPTKVYLTVERVDEALLLRVRDDGRGIPPGQPRGLGLTGMEERAKLIGAALEIRSQTDKGTEVLVHLPLPQ
ncbi:MAG: ATP-binding protein, partial [Chloroflexota bacterium]